MTNNKEKHHPSCTPNDRDLVWHCWQCGLNESAADIEQQLAAERIDFEGERTALNEWIAELQQQLAAEQKQFKEMRDNLSKREPLLEKN